MARLVLTNSYFSLFPILNTLIENGVNDVEGKNLIFCEEKVSLMAERSICSAFGGSFNTEVYSFGNFLRVKKTPEKLLSKEGSAMAVKRILSDCKLTCFKAGKVTLAPALYDLIMQLKSARINPEDVSNAAKQSKGVLKNKLSDIAEVFNKYEQFIKENGFEDQSTVLSHLPEIIRNDLEIKNADVFIVGFSGWTKQMRVVIETLLDCAKSVTAILVEGENPLVYVNETADYFRLICDKKGVRVDEIRCDSGYCENAKLIVDNLFNPIFSSDTLVKKAENQVVIGAFSNPLEEITAIAEIIKTAVLNGECRYRDFSVALGDSAKYKDYVETAFNTLSVPYFFDEQKRADNHPLVTLILSYVDCYRKNFERQTLSKFYKNPLFEEDKAFLDKFENYLIKYNVNYLKIKQPFAFIDDETSLESLETMRQKIVSCFEDFNVEKLLETLNVKEKLDKYTEKLNYFGESVEASFNALVFDAIKNILSEMRMMLGDKKLSLTEYKSIFISGVTALKLSPLPQFNDAVFVGGFKETALAKAKNLFVVGLTSDVPNVQADVSLLSDDDINALEEIKVMVEPKIRVVNHREREATAMALSAFSDKLYLSYPTASINGKNTHHSEVVSCIEGLFVTGKFPQYNGYLTEKQGINSFAKACNDFAEGTINDLAEATSFYKAIGGQKLKSLLDLSNKELKEKLEGESRSYMGEITSPTSIEDYFKCPYLAFASHGLKIKSREKGEADHLFVGTIIHDILNGFVRRVKEVDSEQKCNIVFDEVVNNLLENKDYKKFLQENSTKATLDRVLTECRKYCYKTYLSIENSDFLEFKTETAFGEGKFFPSVSLAKGKVKLKGKIDRVDLSQDYFRIVDYKTGKVDVSEKGLFSGTKLQLYLYSAAVKEKYGVEKSVSGLYYMPISDKYEKPEDKNCVLAVGKTIDEQGAVLVQDKNFMNVGESITIDAKFDDKKGVVKNVVDKDVFSGYVDYALAVSNLAAERICEGVIKPTPYEKACEYCEYASLCGINGEKSRTLGKVNALTITESVKGGEE